MGIAETIKARSVRVLLGRPLELNQSNTPLAPKFKLQLCTVFAVAEIRFQVIALGFEGVVLLVFDLPASSARSGDRGDVGPGDFEGFGSMAGRRLWLGDRPGRDGQRARFSRVWKKRALRERNPSAQTSWIAKAFLWVRSCRVGTWTGIFWGGHRKPRPKRKTHFFFPGPLGAEPLFWSPSGSWERPP